MFSIKALAVVALVSAPMGCVGQSDGEGEATATTADAIITAKELPDYGFTALYFSKAGLTAPLVDSDYVPDACIIDGLDAKGVTKASSTVKLVSFDKLKKTATFALDSGTPLESWFDVVPESNLSTKDLAPAPIASFYVGWLSCSPARKPPNPPR
jgi:hypothetical protein